MKITIASGKGGTGKTTLSANLASYLALSHKIVLSDLDVEEPNSGLFITGELVHEEEKFKHIPQWNKDKCILCGHCQKVCNFNSILKLADQIMVFPELCHSCFACSELCPTGAIPMVPIKMGMLKHFKADQLNFIESKLDVGQEQAVPLISQTIHYIDENFDNSYIKLFDSPPGTSCPVIEATKDADFIILITEPTPFGLHDLTLAVDTMRQLGKEFAVIINRHGIGNDGVIKYCQKENIKILAKLPNDRKIAELYSRGELIYPHIPEFASELKKVADYILVLKGGLA